VAGERRAWTRDELLVAFGLYCRTPFGRLHRNNPDIIALAGALSRTPSSLAMKLCNFASLDPLHQARDVSGLSNASAADRTVFAEFDEDWEGLAAESEEARQRLGLRATADAEEAEEAEEAAEAIAHSGPTEDQRVVRTRRAQGLFRAAVLASYDYTCAISGISVPALVQASHIIPWSVSEGRRLDPRNGIALSTLHDRAFDRGLITLDEDLRVVISGRLRTGNPSPIHREALLAIEGRPIRLPTRYRPDAEAMAYHRERVFVG